MSRTAEGGFPEEGLVLGVETSCDETALALVRGGRQVLADLISSQVELHRPYGGVVPELASRRHLENFFPLLDACLEAAGVGLDEVDAVAVTRGPGLIGALLVGVAAAKSLAFARGVPLVGVHHIEAHLHSLTLHDEVERPHLAFVVSGGHTELYKAPRPDPTAPPRRPSYELLARTRDDAAGEAYDKVGKILGLGYPAGPVIDRLATDWAGETVEFPLARMSDGGLDLSFSGLKTRALRLAEEGAVQPWKGEAPPRDADEADDELLSVLAGFQQAVADQVLDRLGRALENHPEARGVGLCGGVSANAYLRRRARAFCEERGLPLWVPPLRLSTDNAVMIAALGHEMLRTGTRHGPDMAAVADLTLEEAAAPAA